MNSVIECERMCCNKMLFDKQGHSHFNGNLSIHSVTIKSLREILLMP
jgi:hypothetical protein